MCLKKGGKIDVRTCTYVTKAASTHPVCLTIRNFYWAKYRPSMNLGQIFSQIFSFIKGQYLAQIKFQIVKQIGYVDALLRKENILSLLAGKIRR